MFYIGVHVVRGGGVGRGGEAMEGEGKKEEQWKE